MAAALSRTLIVGLTIVRGASALENRSWFVVLVQVDATLSNKEARTRLGIRCERRDRRINLYTECAYAERRGSGIVTTVNDELMKRHKKFGINCVRFQNENPRSTSHIEWRDRDPAERRLGILCPSLTIIINNDNKTPRLPLPSVNQRRQNISQRVSVPWHLSSVYSSSRGYTAQAPELRR